jgi:glycosyltransferase involved in cell wall biosynthesis
MNQASVAEPRPLVAVVTPVYNGDKYLQETIDAVQEQTYPKLVHVLLDNASTDRTADVIDANKKRKVPIVTSRNEKTLPICQNFNSALRLAPQEAKYLRLLCADDRMSADCVERMVDVAEADPEILLVGVGTTTDGKESTYSWPADRSVIDGEDVIRGFFRNSLSFFAVHMLMRQSVMDWRPNVYDDAFATGFDFEAVLSILRRGQLGTVRAPLGWVRIHEDSVTSKVALKKHTHYMDWLRALYQHGPHVFSEEEFDQIARRFERKYVRQVLRWQCRQGKTAVQHHWDTLSQTRGDIGLGDLLDAALDGVLVGVGARTKWVGGPWGDPSTS